MCEGCSTTCNDCKIPCFRYFLLSLSFLLSQRNFVLCIFTASASRPQWRKWHSRRISHYDIAADFSTSRRRSADGDVLYFLSCIFCFSFARSVYFSSSARAVASCTTRQTRFMHSLYEPSSLIHVSIKVCISIDVLYIIRVEYAALW